MVTKEQVLEAQKMWGEALVNIGAKASDFESCKELATSVIHKLYDYSNGPVLFKPTRAAQKSFRSTFEGALSYFVGGNEDFTEDHGFAISPAWQSVRFENSGFQFQESSAQAMGHYYFKDNEGNEAQVEYSFGYVWDETSGHLRINLHHSSMPYQA